MTPKVQQPVPAGSPVDGEDRRADPLEIVELLACLLGAAAYVYVIGWAITWARLVAARLPVDASLPMIDNKVLFVAGLRLVVVMAIVFAAMCVVAWAVHAWTWEQRAPEWHSVIKLGRPEAAKRKDRASHRNRAAEGEGDRRGRPASALSRAGHALKPRSRPPHDLDEAPVGDPFVRVIAGFNVGVLAATLGLAAARVLKTPIDQAWPPGRWWDLLAPWALVSTVLALLLAWLGPLRGSRFAHGFLWTAAIAVALVSSAPIGVLLLTWAGIASFGRLYGRVRCSQGRGALAVGHPRHLSFVLSPLPWLLLTVYALVGMAYYALPPVSFSQAIVTTPTGVRTGGYLARTGTGVYLVSCTPLADATSTNELVVVIPSADVRATTTGTTPFVVDSGLRSSLPTLALHAFGIDASTPSWIRPEVRSTRPTCAGDPLPRPSVGYPAPGIGVGVTGGPAPPGGRASDGEPPIEQTSPGIAALARRFQPAVLVTVADPFWPVSVGAVLVDLGRNGGLMCLQHLPTMYCPPKKPTPAPITADLGKPGSSPDDFLEYPASPPLDPDPSGQLALAAFLRGQQSHPVPGPTLRQRLADPGLLNPWNSAQVYFYYAQNTNPATWPAPDAAIKGKLIALQYWFFYPYNYYPTVFDAALMNDAPVAGDGINTDLHQGDWEHVTVLLDAKTRKPLWLYTARHSNEGQYYAWNSPLLSFDQGHPIVQAALGGHPTYDAHCRESLRFAPALGVIRGRVADWIVCGSGRFAFRAATTPLVDIAKAPWGCWRGHFGVATPTEIRAAKLNEGSIQRAIDANYDVAGPRSPLWQAENGGLAADKTPKPAGKPPTDTASAPRDRTPRLRRSPLSRAASEPGFGDDGRRECVGIAGRAMSPKVRVKATLQRLSSMVMLASFPDARVATDADPNRIRVPASPKACHKPCHEVGKSKLRQPELRSERHCKPRGTRDQTNQRSQCLRNKNPKVAAGHCSSTLTEPERKDEYTQRSAILGSESPGQLFRLRRVKRQSGERARGKPGPRPGRRRAAPSPALPDFTDEAVSRQAPASSPGLGGFDETAGETAGEGG